MTAPTSGRTRILLADDEEGLRTLLRYTLSHQGYEVIAVENGERALEELSRGHFDLVLTDVWMPKASGFDVLTHLREIPDPPRAIVMTGDQTTDTMIGAVRGQAYRMIGKPFTIEALLELVQSTLKSKSTAPPIDLVSATPQWIELMVPCEREAAERIHEYLMRLKSDLPENVRDAVGHAFRELLLNAIEWGGQMDPTRKVRISFVRAKKVLIYRIGDPGRGFRLAEVDHAAIRNPEGKPLEHVAVREKRGMRPGGLGILLARAIVDELIYNEAGNEVVFMKYLE